MAPFLIVVALSGCASPLGEWQSSKDSVVVVEEDAALAVGACPWSGSAPAGVVTPELSDVEATEAIALDENLFWSAIESIPDRPDAADFDLLSSSLAGCPLADLVAFEARLALVLYSLDGPKNFAWYEENDPTGFGFVSDDTFLYVRCATVLGGRDNWRDAVLEGTLEWGDDSPDLEGTSEFLLYVAAYAAEAQGIDVQTWYSEVLQPVTVSYETGSNVNLWGTGLAT